ncbi:MAG: 3-keto-5-aminohexanoate cleavage protein [Chloroflexi bacterium]|nr:3-keto-5-aminohexanoate cleavage protein [Chloroflexota bacterium]
MPQEKVIVTAALTGSVHYPSMSPYLPLSPKQIIEDGVRSAEAGAAVLHIHVRNPENGMPTPDLDIFREVLTGIKAKTNAVICLSTGGGMGMSTEQRATPLITFKPEMASLNFGSMNFTVFPGAEKIKEWKYPWEKLAMLASEDYIFPNEAIGAGNFTWSAIGSGRNQMPICAVALAMGGNVRVGLEDSLYISKGVLAKSSAEHVEKIIRIMRELSLEPATPEETRKTLRLKGADKVNF